MTDQHYRLRLPETRHSLTHRVIISDQLGGEHDVYLTAGYYDQIDPSSAGQIGEIFIQIGKQGSTLKGAFDSWAIMISLSLQYGVPLSAIVSKFKHVAFEPSGMTSNSEIPSCSSVVDYAVRWIEQHSELKSE